MNVPRGPLAPFLAAEEPSLAVATQALRFVFLGLFGGQVVVALALGATVAALVPGRPAPNDVFAIVLLAMAALHVPLAALLSAGARRSGGKQAALSSTVLGGVVASVPAWFAALMLISGQRPIYLLVVMTILTLSYALGFLGVGRAAMAATRPTADDRRDREHS